MKCKTCGHEVSIESTCGEPQGTEAGAVAGEPPVALLTAEDAETLVMILDGVIEADKRGLKPGDYPTYPKLRAIAEGCAVVVAAHPPVPQEAPASASLCR